MRSLSPPGSCPPFSARPCLRRSDSAPVCEAVRACFRFDGVGLPVTQMRSRDLLDTSSAMAFVAHDGFTHSSGRTVRRTALNPLLLEPVSMPRGSRSVRAPTGSRSRKTRGSLPPLPPECAGLRRPTVTQGLLRLAALTAKDTAARATPAAPAYAHTDPSAETSSATATTAQKAAMIHSGTCELGRLFGLGLIFFSLSVCGYPIVGTFLMAQAAAPPIPAPTPQATPTGVPGVTAAHAPAAAVPPPSQSDAALFCFFEAHRFPPRAEPRMLSHDKSPLGSLLLMKSPAA